MKCKLKGPGFFFAISFLQYDLASFRPGDWLNLRDDLEKYTGWKDLADSKMAGQDSVFLTWVGWEISNDEIVKLQTEARKIVDRLLSDREALLHHEAYGGPFSTKVTAQYRLMPSAKHPGQAFLYVIGNFRDTFLITLHHLLSQDVGERLSKCPECSALFLRVRKQIYCSSRCSDRAYMRKWREDPENKKKESQINQRRYAKRMRAKIGARKLRIALRRNKSGGTV